MMVQRRDEEQQQKELMQYNQENRILSHAAANEQRLAFQRRAARQERYATELEMDRMLETQAAEARRKHLVQEQNSRLSDELQRRKADKMRREIEIQRICSQNNDLQKLEEKLKVAYLNKERAVQCSEQQLARLVDQDMEQALDDKMEHARQMAIKAEYEKQSNRRGMASEQRAMLQMQMEERRALEEEAAYEAARDKEMVDAVVAKIDAEEAAEQERYHKKREETREMVRAAEMQRKRDLELKAAREAEEEARIQSHMKKMAEREAQIEEEKKRKKEVMDAKFRAVCESTRKENDEEEELRMLRDMLWEEELEAARIREDREKKQQREEAKRAMFAANQLQLEQRRARLEEEKKEEEKLVQIMLDRFRMDEEREKAEEAGRADAKREHKERMAEQRRERARLYEEEKALELEEMQAAREREAYEKMVVEEARKRLLEKHADVLNECLPKGTLNSKDELNYVRSLALKHGGDGIGH
ncbi:unnamed protein product [Chrysoparadoxa australica]